MKSHEGWRPEIDGWSSDILPWYAKQAESLPDGAIVVEVGVYHGRSALFLAEALYEAGKTSCIIYAVDSWVWHVDDWEKFSAHLEATTGCVVVPVRGDSAEVANRMMSQADLVFLDTFHSYEEVRRDLEAWRPVVKRGGIFSGHDYVHGGAHAGVGRAVDEMFPDGVQSSETVWWVTL